MDDTLETLQEDTPLQEIVVKMGDHNQRFHGTWYRGSTINYIPTKMNFAEEDAAERYVLKGWLPPAPLIDKTSVVTAFGSCFAQNISDWLLREGYNVLGKKLNLQSHIIRFGDGIVNTFSIREQLEWAFENKSLVDGLWFGEHKEIVTPDDSVRQTTADLLRQTSTLIITLGLSEIWYDKQSGRAFWRAIPASMFDEEHHGFRLTTVEENRENLRAICDLVKKHVPDCNVIFTLSPIPLMATFRPVSCITANSVSKAILRVALDELMQRNIENVYYFPSYELVKEVFADPYLKDNRHVKPELIEMIMKIFGRNYCSGE